MEKRDLMVIEVTVFPRSGKPYQTTIRQFITADQLGQLDEGALVTFYEDMRPEVWHFIARFADG